MGNWAMPLLTCVLSLLWMIQTAQALGGFIDTCPEIRFWDPDSIWGNKYKTSPYLVARCTSSDGDDYCTWLPLTMCYSNIDGQLVARSHGAFHKSCQRCEYNDLTTELTCLCHHGEYPKQWSEPTVNLNETLKNDDGNLSCHDIIGFSIGCNDVEFMKLREVKLMGPDGPIDT